MARAGEQFKMPDGSVYIVRHPAAETNGESVEMEFVLPSGCVPPPPHIRRHQTGGYEVLEGRFDVVIRDEWRTLEPGDPASVPVGALHTFLRAAGVKRKRVSVSTSTSRWSCSSTARRSAPGAGASASRCS
jgi:mannose-6-phosphate isomerase-like protein (cupin superfamily)